MAPGAPASIVNAEELSTEDVLSRSMTQPSGLSLVEANARLNELGPNRLPAAKPPALLQTFIRQFLNPLIYVLLAVAVLSLLVGHVSDSGFIFVVLLLNAVIGSAQELKAAKSALALRQVVSTKTLVRRENENFEIPSESLVIGDVILLESGQKVPADIRLMQTHDLEADESLLTGESHAIYKNSSVQVPAGAPLGDRLNMAFAGSLIAKGRAEGIVCATGASTELGRIASEVIGEVSVKTPLILRMESFTSKLSLIIIVIIGALAGILFLQGRGILEVVLFSVGLAVSAIPEGLPVAITVALAVASRRMATKKVIVRHLPAVEALGSCTFIGTDKTGTLTVNELTVKRILVPGQEPWEVTGAGRIPEGELVIPASVAAASAGNDVERLCLTAVLCNEGFLGLRDGHWIAHGDAVDVALLVMAHKLGITRTSLKPAPELRATIPFESENQFAATCHLLGDKNVLSVKGAVERVLPMCSSEEGFGGKFDANVVEAKARDLAKQGYRVLALASKTGPRTVKASLGPEELVGLSLVGLVGMIDPLRPEAKASIEAAHAGGLRVAMITGDHPETALAIARELGLATSLEDVVTGAQLRAKTDELSRQKINQARVFARVDPLQKLQIVDTLIQSGHFVAVTGDGVNDAPALKAAHVGISMGISGTDVARETADLILTDDRFSSLVDGIEQGRIAYSNIRKVIYLLISTGASEIALFVLAVAFDIPLPLTAVQLLWLNLVTNGIQHVGLAFETGEGDELRLPPRPPKEPIFNRIMVERVIVSAAVMGCVSFFFFRHLIEKGMSESAAHNHLLLTMVLFENLLVFNARSELKSIFKIRFFKNPVLLIGTLAAQLIHIGAMHWPAFGRFMELSPISFGEWLQSLVLATSVLIVVELHKWIRRIIPIGRLD